MIVRLLDTVILYGDDQTVLFDSSCLAALLKHQKCYSCWLHVDMDSTFFEAKLARQRPGRGQLVEAKAETKILASQS